MHDHSGIFGTPTLERLLSREAPAGHVRHDGPAGSPEASELCWDKAFQAYGSTKSMLSGMKRPRWDVWLEASGVPGFQQNDADRGPGIGGVCLW